MLIVHFTIAKYVRCEISIPGVYFSCLEKKHYVINSLSTKQRDNNTASTLSQATEGIFNL